MKRIVPRHTIIQSPADVARMMLVANKAGYQLSLEDAQLIWSSYSEADAATWLTLPANDAILLMVLLTEGIVED